MSRNDRVEWTSLAAVWIQAAPVQTLTLLLTNYMTSANCLIIFSLHSVYKMETLNVFMSGN